MGLVRCLPLGPLGCVPKKQPAKSSFSNVRFRQSLRGVLCGLDKSQPLSQNSHPQPGSAKVSA